ncbi:fumarate reductase flavoprotein subunit|uniref:Uncharacterized protein n=1 Tax=Brenneria salicis ATCC 15712 = DSM 30166 TaxID=714314 RepID=A0A366HWB0_9GAMM|nr:hypothetical protein [Brenneria salicis]NMN92622.1 fumarate reductase flavoprotein subunit [Brenneria salicis ATCC 15712 = DSM 30166]RBP57521.1 hypothetical protein DES54_1643 [Brenneria salicis ATCC 15712 = DSM 30166]RLM28680.1 hypothetical protein BHG07_17010 [Brenneria salicis ATCC 15712 = DSM 30166]
MKIFRNRLLATLCMSIMGLSVVQAAETAKPEISKHADVVIISAGAAGMYGDTYDLLLEAGTFGFVLNSGRITAENALNYIGSTSK